jgi:hypothetical protein
MLIDVRERGKTMRATVVSGPFADFCLPDQIAQRFRAAGVTVSPAKRIDRFQQIVIDGNGDALHDLTSADPTSSHIERRRLLWPDQSLADSEITH